MEVRFGVQVFDRDGKEVGTVNKLIVNPRNGRVTDVVVHQGEGPLHLQNRRDIVVPVARIKAVGPPLLLSVSAAEMGQLDFFQAPHYRPMADSWDMPAGFDTWSFFLVAGDGWTEATLPFQSTSPEVSGAPGWIEDLDSPYDAAPAVVAPRMLVFDNDARPIGAVARIDVNPKTGKVTEFALDLGFPPGRSRVTLPASSVAHVGDRIVLNVSEADVKARASSGMLAQPAQS